MAMCLGYYGWSVAVLGFGWGPFVFAWLVLAVTAAPAAGAAVWWAAALLVPAWWMPDLVSWFVGLFD